MCCLERLLIVMTMKIGYDVLSKMRNGQFTFEKYSPIFDVFDIDIEIKN